jgi:hypothetical protein
MRDCWLLIGSHGLLKDMLEDLAYVHERKQIQGEQRLGRPISFVHGYVARTAEIEALPTLGTLQARQRMDLQEILRRANGGEDPVTAQPAILQAATQTSQPETEWDHNARSFAAGDRRDRLATFTLTGELIAMDTPARSSTTPAPRGPMRAPNRMMPGGDAQSPGYSPQETHARGRIERAMDVLIEFRDDLKRMLTRDSGDPEAVQAAESHPIQAHEICALERQGLNPEEIGARLGLATGEVMAIQRRSVR